MEKSRVLEVRFLKNDKRDEREIIAYLSNGAEIHIIPCHNSWEQYGGTIEDLQVTMSIARKHNAWLHGSGKNP